MTDNAEPIFLLDTNILVYNFDRAEKHKHPIAEQLLNACWEGKVQYAISLQNLSEFFVIVTKKISKPLSKEERSIVVRKMIEFNGLVKLEPSQKTIRRALDIVLKSNVSYWDALIAATMIENEIFNIYTENTKDFSRIEGIKAKNPFS